MIRAKPGLAPFKPRLPTARGAQATTSLASQASRLSERAYQDREIVYFLNDPTTSSFSLYHDYTESRPGVKQLLQRRPSRQPCLESVGEDARHR